MNILIDFDDEYIDKFAQGKSKLLFKINFENNGIYYPMKGWLDFGCAILGMWIIVAIDLLEKSDQGQFVFMDGPYAMKAKLHRNEGILELKPRGENLLWIVPIKDFIIELIQAIDKFTNELELRNIGEKEQEDFSKYAKILKNHLATL